MRGGPKTCLLISAGGSGLGYLLQGSASFWRGSPGGLQAVLVGYAIAGLFSGTRPVLYAVMKDATKKNQNLFNKRIGIFFAFYQGGAALAFVIGLISQKGLSVPLFVLAAFSGLTMVFLAVFFTDPENTEPACAISPENRRPATDKWLLTGLLGTICLFMVASAMILTLQLLIELPEFGLTRGSTHEIQKRVTLVMSLFMLPYGLISGGTLIFYGNVSSRIGDLKIIYLSSLTAPLFVASFGFLSSLWTVVGVYTLMACCNLCQPAIVAVITDYASCKYPLRHAEASAVPYMGVLFGSMLGPLIFMRVAGEQPDRFQLQTASSHHFCHRRADL